MANDIELGQSGTSSQASQKNQWEKVHTSLQLRWPDLKSDELRSLPQDEQSVRSYVTQRTQASNDEVDAVIKQHLGKKGQTTSSISQSTKDKANAARESAASLYERTEHQFIEHPAQGVLITFLGGFALGAIVTSMLMQASKEPEPTTWQRYRPSNWR